MLFAVISDPLPGRPSQAIAYRQGYWEWLAPLQAAGTVRHIYARTGRGALAVLEVDSHEMLHRLLNEWAEIVPARFDVLPLIDPVSARAFLSGEAVSASTLP